MITNHRWYYNVICIWMILTFVIVFVENVIGPTLNGQLSQIIIYGSILLFAIQKNLNRLPIYIWIYILALLFSTFIHYSNPAYDRPFLTAIHWIFLMLFLPIALKKYDGKWILYVLIAFYVINCLMGIYERLSQSYIFTYNSGIMDAQQRYGETQDSFFRAFALLGHPLYNANVTSMIMAFILMSDKIKKYLKVSLVVLGILALLAFNSRAAMLIWGGILVYYFFSKYKYTFVILCLVVAFFFTQPLIQLLMDSEVLGRLAEGVNDESTETRLIAYITFAAQNWDLTSRWGGLGVIYYPLSEVSLENGMLLTLGYWGWYAGAYKVGAELYATYKAIKKSYNFEGIIIIFMASWGVAFCNNNSFSFLIFSFLILSILAFSGYGKYLTRKK